MIYNHKWLRLNLNEIYRFREDQALDLCKVTLGSARSSIDEQLVANSPAMPSMSVVDWKLQVALAKR